MTARATRRVGRRAVRASVSRISAGGPQDPRRAASARRSTCISEMARANSAIASGGTAGAGPPYPRQGERRSRLDRDEDPAECDADRAPLRRRRVRQRIAKPSEVGEHRGREMLRALAEEREATGRLGPGGPEGPIRHAPEADRVELEPGLHLGREHGGRQQFDPERPEAGATRLDGGGATARERVEDEGAGREARAVEQIGDELRGVPLHVGPPAVDRDLVVVGERDAAAVPAERDPTLRDEPLGVHRGVDEPVAGVQAFEVPEDPETAPDLEDAALLTERLEAAGDGRERAGDPLGDLSRGRADGPGLGERRHEGSATAPPDRTPAPPRRSIATGLIKGVRRDGARASS